MATFNQSWPTTGDNYQTLFVPRIQDNFLALGKMMEGDTVGAPVSGLKRYNLTSRQFERYNGSAWVAMDLSGQYSSQSLIVGHTANIDIGGLTAGFTVASVNQGVIGAASYANSANGTVLSLAKSRAAAIGTHTLVTANDILGSVRGLGSDGSSFHRAAQIDLASDGTAAAGSMPGRIVLSTTPTGSTVPVAAMTINNSGSIAIGNVSLGGYKVRIGGTVTGATSGLTLSANTTFASDVTTAGYGFQTSLSTAAATFTLASVYHYFANGVTLGAGSSVTSQMGFYANSSLTTAANNYGFYGNIANAAGRWNFYANGTAPNYFAGNVYIGTTSPYTLPGSTVPCFQNVGNSSSSASWLVSRHTADALGPVGFYAKSRGTPASPAAVVNADVLGNITFSGHDGTNFQSAAQISCVVDGTPAAGVMPGALAFYTTPTGSATPVEAGRFRPDKALVVQGLVYGRGGGSGMGQVTVSTSGPSGGADGDMWFQY